MVPKSALLGRGAGRGKCSSHGGRQPHIREGICLGLATYTIIWSWVSRVRGRVRGGLVGRVSDLTLLGLRVEALGILGAPAFGLGLLTFGRRTHGCARFWQAHPTHIYHDMFGCVWGLCWGGLVGRVSDLLRVGLLTTTTDYHLLPPIATYYHLLPPNTTHNQPIPPTTTYYHLLPPTATR